jgi:prepilin-type N-terminal cleavage/methylation domain-containing protein
MDTMELKNRRSERGFTLVELAIVMIIIGLLIGGILKGQELIANAQIAATVAQVKAIDAATTTFKDKYDGLPGDILAPNTRLANCTAAPCSTPGDGNGRLPNAAAGAVPAGESTRFFIHLSVADLIGGIANDGTTAWGDIYPAAKVAGGFRPLYTPGGSFGANAAAPAGHYLNLVLTPTAAGTNTTLTANQAARIDAKLDDSQAATGSVFVSTQGAGCALAGVYDQDQQTKSCDLLVRFQN